MLHSHALICRSNLVLAVETVLMLLITMSSALHQSSMVMSAIPRGLLPIAPYIRSSMLKSDSMSMSVHETVNILRNSPGSA